MYILRTREEKLFGWVDTSDKLNLITALLNKTLEDIQKDTFKHVQDFVVMLMDLHFQIKTDELVMLVVPTAMIMVHTSVMCLGVFEFSALKTGPTHCGC